MGKVRLDNLPIEMTSFVGRHDEVTAISNLLDSHRLVSLVGPGGVGKTRLATRVASVRSELFDDGLWVIDLSLTSDPEIVPDVFSGPFDVGDVATGTARTQVEVLVDFLAEKSLLLIVDNIEHVLVAVRSLLTTLLEWCPDVKILATSREPVDILGEIVYRVSPLGFGSGTGGARSDSVKLFLERLALVDASYQPDQHELEAIEAIVTHLDGLPLAIELAASRAKLLSPTQILERLPDLFRFLQRGSGVADRHGTLQATMAWSYDLLGPREKSALQRLSVFKGWTLDAAESVLGPEALESLGGLVDKSLVEVVTGERDNRYRMLETVRQYGLEQLEEPDSGEEARDAHSQFYLALAEASDAGLRTDEQAFWVERIKPDHDNIRTALGWALDTGQGDLALRFVAAMGRYWFVQTHWAEALRWYRRATDLAKDDHPLEWARAFFKTGSIELITQGAPRDPELVEEAYRVARDVGTVSELAMATYFVAEVRSLSADPTELIDESIRLFREGGDKWGESYAKRWLGSKVELFGDPLTNVGYQREAVEGFTKLGDRWSAGWLSFDLGFSLLALNRLEEALMAFQSALDFVADLDDRLVRAHATRGLGSVSAGLEDYENAERLLLDSVPMFQRIGDVNCLAFTHMYLSDVLSNQGRTGEVPVLLSEAMRGFVEVNHDAGIAAVLRRLAREALVAGDAQLGARLAGAADGLEGGKMTELSPHERAAFQDTVDRLTESFSLDELDRLRALGSSMETSLLASQAIAAITSPVGMPVEDAPTEPEKPIWPEEYDALRAHLEKEWGIDGDIHLLRELGGKSGAWVTAVDLASRDFSGQAILKLEQGDWAEPAEQEARRHELAWTNEPEFAEAHLPRVVHTLERDGSTALLATIAARGLEYAVPWQSSAFAAQLVTGQNLVRELLTSWNAGYRLSESALSPQEVLAGWLDYRLDPGRGRIHGFLSERGLDPLTNTLIWDGHWYPNPLSFATGAHPDAGGVRIRPIAGNIHGDLHGFNVLVQAGEAELPWYLIDLAFFEPDAFLFFDHAYFELSHLLESRSDRAIEVWTPLLAAIAGRGEPSGDDVGLVSLLGALRTATWEWVEDHEPDRVSAMESQILLARVAVGLNFTHKRIPDGLKERGFLFAMDALKTYVKFHGFDWPRIGPDIQLKD